MTHPMAIAMTHPMAKQPPISFILLNLKVASICANRFWTAACNRRCRTSSSTSTHKWLRWSRSRLHSRPIPHRLRDFIKRSNFKSKCANFWQDRPTVPPLEVSSRRNRPLELKLTFFTCQIIDWLVWNAWKRYWNTQLTKTSNNS